MPVAQPKFLMALSLAAMTAVLAGCNSYPARSAHIQSGDHYSPIRWIAATGFALRYSTSQA